MKKLLWVGDAACDSGFARCTHNTLKGFLEAGFEVAVLGLNYRGDPHSYPYPIYPAYVPPRGDLFGTRRLREIVAKEKPDVIVIQNDPWNIPSYVEKLDDYPGKRPFLVGAIAVDGKNCRGRDLNGLDHVVFWTTFAAEEAKQGGFTKTHSVVPLGVDLTTFHAVTSKVEARRALGLPEFTWHGFFVLNVNRNQPRKRLDLTVKYFTEFIRRYQVHDAFLYLHVCPTGDMGYDLDQLAGYYGLKNRVILAEPGVYCGSSEAELLATYAAADVQLSTTQGEGWGLTTMEGMACGVPQIVPDWSALGEWATAAYRVPCSNTCVTPNRINVIGGVPDEDATVHGLHAVYTNRHGVRDTLREAGLALVERPEYRWENIAATFAAEVERAWRAAQA